MQQTDDHRSLETPISRRTALRIGAAGAGLAAGLVGSAYSPGALGAPDRPIHKPLPKRWFVDYGTNAEMRWDSVSPSRYLTPTSRLFVRNHTATPDIDATTYALRIFGDGLRTARTAGRPVLLSYERLHEMPSRTVISLLECTGNGRSFYDTQQGTPADGTQWQLGAAGTIRWRGVPLADVLNEIGLADDAVDVMATGLDEPYVSEGVDYGHVRRPFPIAKALDDALLVYERTVSLCCPITDSRCACCCPAGPASRASSGSVRSRSPAARCDPHGTRRGTG